MPTPATQAALEWLAAHAPPPSDPHETVALAVHALLLHHGFRPADIPADQPATQLPSDWGGAGYGGLYRHSRSALTFDIRGVRMGRRLVMHAAAHEDDAHMHTVDVRVDDFVVPTEPPSSNQTSENGPRQWHTALQRIDDLGTLVAVQIAHRIVPDAAKEGYEDAAAAQTQDAAANGGAGGSSSARPSRPLPAVPMRDDPLRDYDPLRVGPPRRPFPHYPTNPPDVVPFGSDDLLPPGLQPRPGGLFGPGGNLMGPGAFGGRPRGGMPLPPGVPPGARFDPYGPMPDNDIEQPPGFEDEHGLLGGGGRGGQPMGRGGGRGAPRGGGFDDGPPPGMYW